MKLNSGEPLKLKRAEEKTISFRNFEQKSEKTQQSETMTLISVLRDLG
jgi:hypothetical protein